MQRHHTCRFCGAQTFDSDSGIKYGRRHWAHFGCYLDKGKSLTDLASWQVGRFPYKLILKHGKMDEAKRLMDRAA